VPGGEARRDVRAAAHLAGPGGGDRLRQVPRRPRPGRPHGRALGALRPPSPALREPRGADDADRLPRPGAYGHRVPRRGQAGLVVHGQRRDRVRGLAVRPPRAVHDRLVGRDAPGRRRGARALRVDHGALPGAHQGPDRHQGPGLLRDAPGPRALPDAALGRVRALEVRMARSASLFGLLGLVFLAFGFVATALVGVADPYVLANLIAGAALVVAYLAFGFEDFRRVLGERSTRYGASA